VLCLYFPHTQVFQQQLVDLVRVYNRNYSKHCQCVNLKSNCAIHALLPLVFYGGGGGGIFQKPTSNQDFNIT
jgi:hypothetical protein